MHGSLPRRPARAQRGISLIIAMLMLVVIGLMSVAVLRNSSSADQVATGNRLQTQANQYAQIALKFCENQIVIGPTSPGTVVVPFPVQSPAPEAWTVKNNWVVDGTPTSAFRLRATDLTGAAVPAARPQCMAEKSAVGANVYRVTARGFSADYTADPTSFATVTGSVVWLQSTLYAAVPGS